MIEISKDKEALEKLDHNLNKKNYILTSEGSLSKYLGIDVKYDKKGGFELTQLFLIDRIIDLLEITNSESMWTARPTITVKPLLHKDLDGVTRKNSWSYCTAIGMLTTLQGTMRPRKAL